MLKLVKGKRRLINVTSPESGASIGGYTTTLHGTISSAEVIIEEIAIYIGGTKYPADVDSNGDFSIPVALNKGDNYLFFETYGRNSNGDLIQISPTNMDTQQYILKVSAPASVILMSLTWDKNDTDLDLYVIDPTGDYSCYYNKVTNDGGELDLDDVNGYGPEHWTLMESDTVRYGQPYRLRIHYYNDNGHGGTNYTVKITTQEGTSLTKNYFYTGYMSTANSSNDAPDDFGPDWANVVTIQLNSSTSAPQASMNDVSLSPIESIDINTYVPPVEMRGK